jgi:hypothetical protein
MNGRSPARTFTVDGFVQSFTAQLDRAQELLALKAKNMPLTFALKDLKVDLRVFWDVDAQGDPYVRHAGPNEEGASTLELGFTTITRTMAEENTFAPSEDDDPRLLKDLDDPMRPEDQRRLELAGVRTVGQLRRLAPEPVVAKSETAVPHPSVVSVARYLDIPALRLQQELFKASRPSVQGHETVRARNGELLLRILGVNLSNGEPPEVRLAGEPVEVLEASPRAVLVRPLEHHGEGDIELSSNGSSTSAPFRLDDRGTP